MNIIVKLEKTHICQIIYKINNPELYKECLEGKVRFEFELTQMDIIAFIESIDENDPEFNFTRACIEGRIQLGVNVSKNTIIDLIKKIDKANENRTYVRDIIEGRIHINMELDSTSIIDLIEFVDSNNEEQENNYARECIIENHITDNDTIIELLRKIDDIEFTKECITNNFELIYLFDPYDVEKLENPKWNEEYLRQIGNQNIEMLRFYRDDFISLIKSTNNPEFIKDCIEGRISTFVPTKYTEQGINEDVWVPIKQEEIVSLIKAINDEEYTKLCISGEISLNSPLSERNKSDLLISTQNIEYITECIKSANELGIDTNYVIKKISTLPNAEKYAEEWLKNWQELKLDGEAVCSLIKLADNDIAHKIEFDKLEEILSMKDAEHVQSYLLDNVILKNMGQENIDVEGINSAIEKTHEIFLTSTLPTNFKLFEFFKYHKNHNSKNANFYNGIEDETRDMIISRDLFRTLVESDDIQMRNFLELLYNGNIALNQENSNDDISKAILLEYRDILFSLAKATEDIHLAKTQDYMQDLTRIKKHFNLEDGQDIGDALLERYFKDTGIEYQQEGRNIVETLLEVMNNKRKEAHKSNQEAFQLSEGDIIKGTNMQFVGDMLRNGIRAKEFLLKGNMDSDATPLDTDFSEISEENLQQGNLSQVLDSTYTGSSFGQTYLVIRRSNYEEDEVSYTRGSGTQKTRYFRTGIGSTNISAIITSEWNEEYKYMLASNGFYIPVIDKSSGQVLFTIEEYNQIRQSMQGLSHFGVSEYSLDDTVYDEDVRRQAEELRKKAEGKASTEEKRQAVVESIRKHIGRELTTEMLGDISSKYLELIDTGSTGRGTNIPGDGDFDFMLKCSSREEQQEMIAKIKTFLTGKDKGGTGPYAIRYTDVEVEKLDEPVEVDVTAEQKRLEVDYSSDLAIRDRLSSIREQYGEDALKAVVDNIIVAKKLLKESGVYKKVGSTGATELGGFGGIGVENWILQNGGSLTKAMQTFLEHTVDENGNDISFSEFKRRYPIYDFGQNHRFGSDRHDHYVEGLSEAGFERMKELFREKLKDRDTKPHEIDILGDSIVDFTKRAAGYVFSDMSRIYSLIAQLRTHEQSKEQQSIGEI